MNNQKTAQAGFTLVELMVVIAIISILAAFTAPSFERHIAKANLVDIQLLSNSIMGDVDAFVMIHAVYPTDTELDDLLPSYSHISEIDYISNNKVDTFQGEITITLKDAIGIDAGEYLKFSRQNSGQWLCTTTIDNQIKPEHCSAVAVGDSL